MMQCIHGVFQRSEELVMRAPFFMQRLFVCVCYSGTVSLECFTSASGVKTTKLKRNETNETGKEKYS